MNKIVKLDAEKETDVAAHIHALSHDGRGIASIANKTTFISGALCNELVTYKITQKRSQYNEADMLEVLNPAKERVNPPCQHFGVCGGCSLQHMLSETQLAFKQQTLLDQFKHFGKLSPETVLAPLNATTLGYRRKARLGVKFVYKKNKLLVGFREKSSNYLADLKHCVVLHPAVGEKLLELSKLITTLTIDKQIPQIEVAIGDTDVALIFRHLEDLTAEDKEKLIAFAKQYHFQIYLQPGPPASVHQIWPDEQRMRLTYTLPDFQLEFLFHPLDFTQVNLEMNRLIVKQAIQLLDLQSTDKALDLFCGIGNFSLPMARSAQHVTGIEGSIDMVERAHDNAKHNHIDNVSFFAADLHALSLQAHWLNAQYDKILLDPPRAGAKEILPHVKKFAATKIVYVSCNPATLSRDAGILVHELGYKLKAAGVMNMFAHTSHIEAMALFEK